MSSPCSHCGGTGKISNLRVPDPSKHPSAGMGMVKCQICGGSGQLGFDLSGTRQAGESLGELIGEYLPIFVFMFFSANYIPRLIQSYFGLSADVYQNITVVGVLLIIPIIIFRKRLTGRAGWIGAVALIAAAIFSPDIVTPEEKVQMAAFEEFRPLMRAAQGHGTCTQDIINMKKSGTPNNLEEVVIHCDAMEANFTELAESSSDEFVAKLCAPPYSGASTKTLHREQSPVVDNFCKSRNL